MPHFDKERSCQTIAFDMKEPPGIPVEHRLTKPVCTLVVTTEFRLVTCFKGELEQIWAGERHHNEVTTLFHHRAAPAYRKSSWHPQAHLDSVLHPRSDIWTSITSLFFASDLSPSGILIIAVEPWLSDVLFEFLDGTNTWGHIDKGTEVIQLCSI